MSCGFAKELYSSGICLHGFTDSSECPDAMRRICKLPDGSDFLNARSIGATKPRPVFRSFLGSAGGLSQASEEASNLIAPGDDFEPKGF